MRAFLILLIALFTNSYPASLLSIETTVTESLETTSLESDETSSLETTSTESAESSPSLETTSIESAETSPLLETSMEAIPEHSRLTTSSESDSTVLTSHNSYLTGLDKWNKLMERFSVTAYFE